MNLHEIEEMEYEASRGDRLWDAGEGVCCAAFQLGACEHTEAFDPYDYDEEFDLAMEEQERIMDAFDAERAMAHSVQWEEPF